MREQPPANKSKPDTGSNPQCPAPTRANVPFPLYPSHLPIPHSYLSLTGTYPLQVPIPYRDLSLTGTYALQLPIPGSYLPLTVANSLSFLWRHSSPVGYVSVIRTYVPETSLTQYDGSIDVRDTRIYLFLIQQRQRRMA